MNNYMEHTHPDAFVDWKHLEAPNSLFNKECPCCKGFGGWNLKMNSYHLPEGYPDTTENRHRYVHFRCQCSHCNGWGYVSPKEKCDGHEWVFEKNLERCYNRYRCTKCEQTSDVDSSD